MLHNITIETQSPDGGVSIFNYKLFVKLLIFFIFATSKLSRGVIGNTSDSGSEEWEFETLRDN